MRAISLLIALAFAHVALGQLHPLTMTAIHANQMQSHMHYADQVMRNPHMREFYHKYYIYPEETQRVYLEGLEKKVGEFASQMKTQYPYGGYSPLEPSLYNRLVVSQPIGLETRKLANKIKLLNELNKRPALPEEPSTPPALVAELKETIRGLKKAARINRLEHEHDPSYPRPFQSAKMQTLLDSIKKMESQVKKPLETSPINPEELSALNSLNAKMDEITTHLTQAPSAALTEETKSQGEMIERLTSMMRRMSNAVSADRRESFLHALHLLLHRHRLADHPAMLDFEREMALSFASGAPLQHNAAAVGNRERRLQDANVAKAMARRMKDMGRTVEAQGKELEHRTALAEARQVPLSSQQELEQHIRARLKRTN